MAQVTLVIATYNRPRYVEVALRSALAQTHRDIEILVSEDGGPEVTEAVVRRLGDSRVRFRRNAQNAGAAGNKLISFQEVRTEFFANLDDDDMLEPAFVEKLLPPLLADRAVNISFSDHFLMDPEDRILAEATDRNTRYWKRAGLKPGVHREFWRAALLDRSIPVAQSSMIRKAAVDFGRFKPETSGSWDLFLSYLVWSSGGAAYYVPERLTRHRVHPGQFGLKGQLENQIGTAVCFETFMSDSRLADHRALFEREWARYTANAGILYLRQGKRSEARHWLFKSLSGRKSLRALGGAALSLIGIPWRGTPAR